MICRVFKREGTIKISVEDSDGKKCSVPLEDFSSFLDEKDNPPFICFDKRTRDYLSEYSSLVDEKDFGNFLLPAKEIDSSTFLNFLQERFSVMPLSLKTLIDYILSKDNGLRKLLINVLGNSNNIQPWEDLVCSKLSIIEERDEPGTKIDLLKTVRIVFGDGGVLQDIHHSYEYRNEQFMTALEVAESILSDEGAMLEAGTGTGKSLAYLVPLAYEAASTGKQAVVSTRTRTLQDQLVKKDIDLLRKLPNLSDLRVAVLKGRERYLCVRKLFESLEGYSNSMMGELQNTLIGLLIWSLITTDGDLDSISIQNTTRLMIAGNRFDCDRKMCPFFERCPYYVARKNASNADITITNHSLLFSEASIRIADGEVAGEEENEDMGVLLPNFRMLVVDEAHELENSLTEAMSFVLFPYENALSLRRALQSVREVLGSLRNKFNPDFLKKMWEKIREHYKLIEDSFKIIISNFNGISPDERKMIDESALDIAMDTVMAIESNLRAIQGIIHQLEQMLDDSDQDEKKKGLLLNLIKVSQGEISEILKNATGITSAQEKRILYVRKIGRNGSTYLNLVSAPVESDNLMKSIFPNVPVKIFVSATLWVFSKQSDGFNYARRVLGLNDSFHATRLGTSFDYENQLRFYVVEDMKEYAPNSMEYMKAGSDIINRVLNTVASNSLVLFTSYRDMNYIVSQVKPNLKGMELRVQKRHGSPTGLVSEHIRSNKSVIFGSRTFWEGIDLPGEQLKLLIVFKLPFDRPDDPLIEARVKHYGTRNYMEGLNKYYYPKMITSFRQGVGRLIRTREDRGIVIVLDKRMIDARKGYSRKLVYSLPYGMNVKVLKSRKMMGELRKLKKEGFV